MQIRDYLQDGEPVLFESGRHPWSLFGRLLFGGLAFVVSLTAGIVMWFILPIWLAILLMASGTLLFSVAIVSSIIAIRTTSYLITPDRCYQATGRIRIRVAQSTFDKVTDTHISQGPIARAMKFGTISLQTAGRAVTYEGILDPYRAKHIIEDARAKSMGRLLRTKPKSSKPVVEEAPASTVLWAGKPSLAFAISNLIPAAVIGLVAIVGGTASIFALGGYGILIIIGGLLLASSIAIGVLLMRKYSNYEVLSDRVRVKRGVISRQQIEAQYRKVTDVKVTQDLLGRIFGFGTIILNTAGSNTAPIVFMGVARPDDLRTIIEEARRE